MSDPSEHKCICTRQAMVGYNGGWYCLDCFDKAMAKLGHNLREIKADFADAMLKAREVKDE